MRTRHLALLLALAIVAGAGCGKKGAPLPPLVRLPAAPDPVAARRLGRTVLVQVSVPTANTDKTTPADVERIDLYALTGRASGPEAVLKSGTRVASIPVRKPASRPPAAARTRPDDTRPPADRPSPPPRPPASMETGFDQGNAVVVTETLDGGSFREVTPRDAAKKRTVKSAPPAPGIAGPLLGLPLSPLPERLYVAVGINHKGRKGAASAIQRVLLVETASPPAAPTVTYTESAFSIAWQPPADAFPPAPGGDALESTPIGSRRVYGAYNVYEVPPAAQAGAAPEAVPPAPGGRMPSPVNAKPLTGSPLLDERMAFGTPRCYVVRAITVEDGLAIEGEASPPACVTPVDTFPPAAPTGLRAVGGEGLVSLIWDANKEADLAGYLVLRSELPDGPPAPLTPEPIGETTFDDTTVKPGVRYAYVVVAVDTSKNRGAPSNRVEEGAR